MPSRSVPLLLAAAGAVAIILPAPARADLLFTNGPIITNPTGGTGNIAGQPISQADPFTVPGQPFTFSTTGINATHALNVAVADNFIVDGPGWKLDAVTLFAFQTGQHTPSVHTIRINLWTEAPFSANSPPPIPSPLPEPVLSQPLVLSAGPGTFIAHRQSSSSTSTSRPIFAYTVSLAGLPNGGLLAPGEYWLEWSFEGAASPSQNVFTPLVSPRELAFDHNARLFNSLDGTIGGERVWFEGREGYIAGVTEGRAYALPFELHGTVIPAPATAAPALMLLALAHRRRRQGAKND